MADDNHPADGLIDAIRGVFNGDNIKQSIRDAWDRTVGNTQQAPAAQTPAQPAPNYQPNAQQQQQISQERGLTPAQAALIRAKAGR
jgi:hypothetical protein